VHGGNRIAAMQNGKADAAFFLGQASFAMAKRMLYLFCSM
jgi:hypothetical protein